MPKLKTDPIEAADIVKYLEEQDGFALELRCIQRLVAHGLSFEHGGTYTDPASGKPRQFDIRATFEKGENTVVFAIECKSLGKHYPLIVSRIPRNASESFISRIDAVPKRTPPLQISRLSGSSLYPVNGPVVKSTVQLGRTTSNEWSAADAETFDKWAQAIASAIDVGEEVARPLSSALSISNCHKTIVIPVMVVSNETLWAVDYDATGHVMGAPSTPNVATLFVGREHTNMRKFSISHLHFCTEDGLADLLKSVCADDAVWGSLFAN